MIYVVGSTTGRLDGVTEPGRNPRCLHHDSSTPTGALDVASTQFNIASAPAGHRCLRRGHRILENDPYHLCHRTRSGQRRRFALRRQVRHLFEPAENLGPGVVTLGGRNKRKRQRHRPGHRRRQQAGSVIVAGSTQGNFDGNAWRAARISSSSSSHRSLTKLWSHQYGTDSNDAAHGVAVDAEGQHLRDRNHGLSPAARASTGRRIWATTISS